MRVVDVLDFACQRGRMILADRFAVAFRELAGVGKRDRVRGVERGEFPLRGFAVGERGGVLLLGMPVVGAADWNDDRGKHADNDERSHCNGDDGVAAFAGRGWFVCSGIRGGASCGVCEFGVHGVEIVGMRGAVLCGAMLCRVMWCGIALPGRFAAHVRPVLRRCAVCSAVASVPCGGNGGNGGNGGKRMRWCFCQSARENATI